MKSGRQRRFEWGAVATVLALVGSFFVPEIRQFVGLEPHHEAPSGGETLKSNQTKPIREKERKERERPATHSTAGNRPPGRALR